MSRKPNNNITPAQLKLVRFIEEYRKANGFPPSVREIREEMGYVSTSSVHYHLRALERKGYIEVVKNTSRGITEPFKDEDPGTDLIGKIICLSRFTAVLILSEYIQADNIIIYPDKDLYKGKPAPVSEYFSLSKDNRYVSIEQIDANTILMITEDGREFTGGFNG